MFKCKCNWRLNDATFIFDGKQYCECCAPDQAVTACHDCGKPVTLEDSVEVYGVSHARYFYACQTCAGKYKVCANCGERIQPTREHMGWAGEWDNKVICADCADNLEDIMDSALNAEE